jgi:hypothetical protein
MVVLIRREWMKEVTESERKQMFASVDDTRGENGCGTRKMVDLALATRAGHVLRVVLAITRRPSTQPIGLNSSSLGLAGGHVTPQTRPAMLIKVKVYSLRLGL